MVIQRSVEQLNMFRCLLLQFGLPFSGLTGRSTIVWYTLSSLHNQGFKILHSPLSTTVRRLNCGNMQESGLLNKTKAHMHAEA